MEVVCESSKDEAGIKLFGKTIIFRSIKENEEVMKADRKTEEKRPEKIIPCPRCKSMETKFCYFNNYNVNQPRHFCKGCQRYWTAGGSLRNVPVGAGRRKNKPACGGLNQFPESYLYGVPDWPFTTGDEDFRPDFLIKRRRASQGHYY